MREDAKQLSEKKGELFYSVVVKLLFIKKRSRHDLATSVGFLTKRVSNSDVDNWEKFRRILRFVHYTLKRKNMFWSGKYRRDINMGGCIICSKP